MAAPRRRGVIPRPMPAPQFPDGVCSIDPIPQEFQCFAVSLRL